MSERLMGQETTVTLTLNGQLVTELTAIKSSEFVFKGQAVSSDYLGQPGPVFDEVSDGVTVKIEFEVDSPQYFDLLARLIRRKRGEELFRVNINTRFNFRSGVSRFCTVPNVSFGDLPMSVPERKQKVKGSLDGMAQSALFPSGV